MPDTDCSSSEDDLENHLDHDDSFQEDDKGVGETWVEYIKRITALADVSLDRAHCRDWVSEQRRRKWIWAGHVARMLMWSPERWTLKLLDWTPRYGRKVGRPSSRWEDVLNNYCKQYMGDDAADWRLYALNKAEWMARIDSFCDWK